MEMPNVEHDGNGAFVGFIYAVLTLIVAERSRILESHIPSFIMDITQWLAWATTIILGLFTIYYKFLKPKKDE